MVLTFSGGVIFQHVNTAISPTANPPLKSINQPVNAAINLPANVPVKTVINRSAKIVISGAAYKPANTAINPVNPASIYSMEIVVQSCALPTEQQITIAPKIRIYEITAKNVDRKKR